MKKIILAVMALAFTVSVSSASTTNQTAGGMAPVKILDNAANGKPQPGTGVWNGWPMNISQPAFTLGSGPVSINCSFCEKPPCFAWMTFYNAQGFYRLTRSNVSPTAWHVSESNTTKVIDIAPGTYLWISGTTATIDFWY